MVAEWNGFPSLCQDLKPPECHLILRPSCSGLKANGALEFLHLHCNKQTSLTHFCGTTSEHRASPPHEGKHSQDDSNFEAGWLVVDSCPYTVLLVVLCALDISQCKLGRERNHANTSI